MRSDLVALAVAGLAMWNAARAQPAAPPSYDPEAYAKAEKCVQQYAVRFAPTAALPQDVADAALSACHRARQEAAIARAHGYAANVTMTTLAVDEPDLRRSAIQALLEARFFRTR